MGNGQRRAGVRAVEVRVDDSDGEARPGLVQEGKRACQTLRKSEQQVDELVGELTV